MKKLLALTLILVALPSQSANMGFLRNSVLTDFGKTEIAEFKKFVRDSLDSIKDGEVVIWKAVNSSLSGKFKAVATYKTNDRVCRRSRFLVANDNKQEVYQFEICKIDGRWQIQDTAVRHLTEQDMAFVRDTAVLALNRRGEAIPFSWFNSGSGNSGVAISLSLTGDDDKICRNVAITVFSKQGRSANGIYSFCREGGDKGEWVRNIQPL